MKFRCERDTLAEAISTAQRAVAVRSGALPVLSGVQLHAADNAVLTADTGSVNVWMLRHIRALAGRRTHSSLQHGTMANAYPQALGIQLAYPHRQPKLIHLPMIRTTGLTKN